MSDKPEFPQNPIIGQKHFFNGKSYEYEYFGYWVQIYPRVASTPIAEDVKGLAAQCVNVLFGENECMKDIEKVNIETVTPIIQTFMDSKTEWRDIESAPVDIEVLMYCPERGIANNERIEMGYAHTSRGSHHSWATKWQLLPTPPAGKDE